MRHHAGPSARLLLIILVALAVVCSSAPAVVAAPTNAQIQAKQAEAAVARNVLADLNDDMEMKAEDYNAINEEVERTRGEIVQATADLEVATANLDSAQEQLGSRARSIYVNGDIDLVEVLLGTSSFDDFVTRVELLNRISESDAALVADVKSQRQRVEESKAALENREAEQVALRAQAAAKRDEVEAAVRRQSSYLASLDAQVSQLIKEEQERQRKLAEEAARRAAANAAKGGAAPRKGGGALGAAHPEAVGVALKYLGVPYVWGGSSPSGFDCSGFTQYVYREIGISLPRTSREQYRVGGFIEEARLDLLQPGDLVFFGYDGDPNRVHHVGIYVGDGNYIHAPGTGDKVSVSSLTGRISSRGDYVGGVRP